MKAIFFSVLVLSSFVSYAQRPGTLDKSFGTGGIINTNFGEKTYFQVNKAKLQTDDKIIVAGDYNPTNPYGPFDVFTIRYTVDGIVDSAYGSNGTMITHIPFEASTNTYGVAITKSNKLLVCGYGYHYENQRRVYDGFLSQLKADGSLDSSFGQYGFTKLNIDGYGFYSALAVQKDGKILVVGKSGTGASFRGFISRLFENGMVDETFGNKGYVNIYSGNNDFSCKVQKDGRIVIAGGVGDDFERRKFFLQRYLPDGRMDKSFGDDGTTLTRFGEDAAIYDIGFQSDGKIIAAGEANFLVYTKKLFATARYSTNGTLDSTFGTGGKTLTNFGDSQCVVMSLAIQKDDRIVLGGYKAMRFTGSDFAMARLASDGVQDSSFGRYGKAFTDSNTSGLIKSVLIQSNGKIIDAGGKYLTTLTGCQLARYYSNVSRQQIVADKINPWLQHHGITWQTDNNVRYYTVQRSLDGGITYQPLSKLYNNHQSVLTYEDASATGDNAVYRVAVVAKDGGRSVSNSIILSNESNIRLFPNPVHNSMQLQGLPAGKAVITIADFSGNIRISAVANSPNFSVTTSALPPGNYLLKVQSGSEITTKAFVKE